MNTRTQKIAWRWKQNLKPALCPEFVLVLAAPIAVLTAYLGWWVDTKALATWAIIGGIMMSFIGAINDGGYPDPRRPRPAIPQAAIIIPTLLQALLAGLMLAGIVLVKESLHPAYLGLGWVVYALLPAWLCIRLLARFEREQAKLRSQ